jgi:hypothetical protein
MSSQLQLDVTDLPSVQDAINDCMANGDKQQILLVKLWDPAFLWIAMFKNVTWQKIEVNESDGDEDDAFHITLPFIEKDIAIENLNESEKYLSDFFIKNGEVKAIISDLINILNKSDRKYIYLNPLYGDFDYNHPSDHKFVRDILKISNGDNKVNEDLLKGLKTEEKSLFKANPIIFKSAVDIFENDSDYDTTAANNLSFLTGIHQEDYDHYKI